MKKLMTVIAAVAMSFGLYAADATIPHFISFEAEDECVDENGKLQKDGWAGDASVIGLDGGYGYPTSADARRTEFVGGETNEKCLKLETGKDVVTCTLADSTKDIFFDQVVKFTGFEEDPTEFTGKIAIWATAIEADDKAETPVPGETNLYITCGTVDGEGTPSLNEKILIRENIDIDAWHRVTIKSLGNVVEGGNVAGFIVYIDGQQVVVDAAKLIVDASVVTEGASNYNASGMLFPALVAGDVASVAYQGIGELDDVAIDDQGPQFARFVEGTVVAINGATLKLTVNGEEIDVDSVTGKFQVPPNSDLVFTYTAIPGNFLTGGKTVVTKEGNIGEKQNYDFRDEIESKVAVASYDGEDGVLYTDSLNDAFANTFGNVKLEKDINLTKGAADIITVSAEFGGEFDLNGHSIQRLNTSDYVMVIPDGASMTLVDYSDEGTGFIKSTPVASGNTTNPASTIVVKGEFILDGAALISDYCCVKVDEDPGKGTFVMNGGTLTVLGNDKGYTGRTYAVMSWGETTIYDGSVTGDIRAMADNRNNVSKSGSVTIGGGTFAPFTAYLYAHDDVVFPTFTIVDGITFTPYNDQVIGLDLKIVDAPAAEGYYAYTLGTKTYVAQINDQKFETLAEAFEAAGATAEIELLTNVELTDAISIANKNVTLSGEFTVSAAGRVFDVRNGATLTIAAETTVLGTGDGKNDTPIFLWPYSFESRKLTDADAANYAKAKLVVNGTVKYTGTAGVAAITQNGNDQIAGSDGVDIVINGTVINTTDAAIYAPGKGTITVNDGAYIEGIWAGIQMKSGTLTVNGGTIKCTGKDRTPTTIFNNGANASGCAIQMEGNTGYAGGMTLVVNGGTIESVNAKAVYAYGEASQLTSITINDGILKGKEAVFQFDDDLVVVPGTSKAQFNHDVSVYCETGFKTVLDEKSGLYKVVADEPTDITVTVKKGEGIATVTVGGEELVFDTNNEATFKVPADAPTATLTLEADNLTIPVYKMSIGKDVTGAGVTNKTPVITADAEKENYFTFTAAEADVNDPEVSETQKKQAIIDAIDDDDPETREAAVAKVNQVVTTEETPAEGKVTASQLATYITEKSIHSEDLTKSDYVVASVKLGTDTLIDKDTQVKVATVDKTTSDLAVTIKIGDNVATVEEIKNIVEVCDDLGAANDWEKLPQSKLKSAVKIEAGKLVITPVAGVDKLFLKVVIPQDATK